MTALTPTEMLGIIDAKLEEIDGDLAAMARRPHGLSRTNRDKIGHKTAGLRRMIEYNTVSGLTGKDTA